MNNQEKIVKEEQEVMLSAIEERFALPFDVKGKAINATINLFYFENSTAFKNSDSYNDFISRTIPSLNFKDSRYVELDDKFMVQINRDRRIKEVLQECLISKQGLYMVYQVDFFLLVPYEP